MLVRRPTPGLRTKLRVQAGDRVCGLHTPGIRISGKSRSAHSLRALSLHVSVKSSVGHVEVAHVCFDAEAPGAPKCHMNPLGANPGLDDQPYPANNRAGFKIHAWDLQLT